MSRRTSLPEMASAVDADRLTGDEVGLDQAQHRFRDLDLAAPSTKRRGTRHRDRTASGSVHIADRVIGLLLRSPVRQHEVTAAIGYLLCDNASDPLSAC